MSQKIDLRQTKLVTQLPFIGNAASAQGDAVMGLIDAELSKLFEDRNILLTDGGTVTFTGTQLQLTEALNIILNQKVSGAVPQIISLGSSTQTFTNSGDMLVAVLNRTAGTATVSIIASGSALPAVVAANEEVFVIAIRRDAGDGTQRLYFRNGSSLNAGQSVRLGQGGSGGSGSGTGDDLDALTFRASFADAFGEASTQAVSSVLTSGTNAAFSAAKSMYTMQYDASKTVTGTGVAMTISAAPSFTVAIGDVMVIGSVAKKITAVASQTSVTIESAFATNPTAAAATISQALYTKDIYNSALDGAAIATSFPGTTFSEILVDYKDNAVANSNVWTPDLTPLVAFVATNDGTNFTTKQVRATNTTDQIGSTLLPSAGSSLSLRFFANATSGTGFANLITYKAFMQKATTSISGGIMNSASAFTNNSGATVNATVGSLGGKTTLTLSWAYAVGANSGTTESSIEVYVNGSKIPRFVSALATPDASFTEVSTNVIQLDRDYSSQALQVLIVQRTAGQPIDSSSANVTAINQQQEIMANGFQGFVSQATMLNAVTTGTTPISGTFYSSVINRAAIVDLSQNLRSQFGIDRMPIQQIYPLQTEFGPNGEVVWACQGDAYNQVRLVGGGWQNVLDVNGTGPYTSTVSDYVEVTFYGTGLTMMTYTSTTGRDHRVTVDNGTEGANIYAGYVTAIQGRNYCTYQPIVIATGLTLGLHTVKIRNNSTNGMTFYGFDFITQNSTVANILTNPGVAYIGGKKIAMAAPSSLSYSSVVTGVRGGRVLQYLSAAGAVAQLWTPVNSSAAYLTSADHTNEDIARAMSPREFGAGRVDDFALGTAFQARSFTLEDGTTTLAASNASFLAGSDGVNPTNSTIMRLTFVGTGLDITQMEPYTGTGAVVSVSVDGVSIGNLDATGVTNRTRTLKVVSGLPYGTHNVLFSLASSGAGVYYTKFTVYQPKKPTLPAGAIELADFNVLATYVANATQNADYIATGVLRKVAAREGVYAGSAWSSDVNIATGTTGAVAAFRTTSGNTSGQRVTYTFFGTGVDVRWSTPTAVGTTSLLIDGVAPTSAGATASGFYGQITSFVASTGVATSNGTGSFANGVWCSGLPLGFHTISFGTTSANGIGFESMDVITPIHSYKSNQISDNQNALLVGSQAVSDNRSTSVIKGTDARGKASYVAYGVSTTTATSTNAYLPMADMSITIKVDKVTRFLIGYSANSVQTSNSLNLLMFLDGQPVGNGNGGLANNSMASYVTGGNGSTISQQLPVTLAPGVHTLMVYWICASATTNYARTMFAIEL